MTADQWKAVESAFNEALEVAESERSIFLESSCPDPYIRLEVRKLLDHVKNDSFLEPKVLDQMRDRAVAQVDLSGEDRQLVEHLTGTLVAGRYRIIRLLGRGGQSIVFLAADQRVGERTVALKVLDSEVIDDGGLQRRFRREITILGAV